MFPFAVRFWFHFSEPGPVGVLQTLDVMQTSGTSEDHQPFVSWDEPAESADQNQHGRPNTPHRSSKVNAASCALS